MKVKITGKTPKIITLNENNHIMTGKIVAILDVKTDEQKRELKILKNNGLISIERYEESKSIVDDFVNEAPKSQPPIKSEQDKVKKAEARTQEMNSKVTIGMGDQNKRGKMTRSAAGDILESEHTKASLNAMKKLQEEEDNDEADFVEKIDVDESKLPPSEQMGRKAVVGAGGTESQIEMKNSAVAGADKAKEVDPFIDREEKKLANTGDDIKAPKADNTPSSPLIDDIDVDDGYVENDPFIDIG